MISELNTVIASLIKRAESDEIDAVVSSFIDVAGLLRIISSPEPQVLYGRRGTGKTHALLYLQQTLLSRGHAAVYIELSKIGSSQSAYGDQLVDLSQRATRLLVDTCLAMREELLALVRTHHVDASAVVPILDDLANAVTELRVTGETTVTRRTEQEQADSRDSSIGLRVSTAPSAEARSQSQGMDRSKEENATTSTGQSLHYVHFGTVAKVIKNLIAALPHGRLWILLDEWTNVPQPLQPFLSDMLRRTLTAVKGVTVKIGAIENQTNWRIIAESGEYMGLHVGPEIAQAADLDELLTFDRDTARAEAFFKELLFRHVQASFEISDQGSLFVAETPDAFVSQAFSSRAAFGEFARAAARVPRDAMSIAGYSAKAALDRKISVKHVRSGARTQFEVEKLKAVSPNVRANALLGWIQDTVIGDRNAKGFLVDRDEARRHATFRFLFDERVVHYYQRSISSPDRPGQKFDAYVLDYGCYVHLADTRRSQLTLFPLFTDHEKDETDVPIDDYRSIRASILRLADFDDRV